MCVYIYIYTDMLEFEQKRKHSRNCQKEAPEPLAADVPKPGFDRSEFQFTKEKNNTNSQTIKNKRK